MASRRTSVGQRINGRSVWSRLTVITAALAATTLLPMQSAQAAQPPPGYPTADILAYGNDRNGISVPLRRGFYDPDVDQGFGWDKAWSKHGITTYTPITGSIDVATPFYTNAGNQNSSGEYRAIARLLECSTTCVEVDNVTVIVAAKLAAWNTYFGWPAGGPTLIMGVNTAYCEGYNPTCPGWVSSATPVPMAAADRGVTVPQSGSPAPADSQPSETDSGTFRSVYYTDAAASTAAASATAEVTPQMVRDQNKRLAAITERGADGFGG